MCIRHSAKTGKNIFIHSEQEFFIGWNLPLWGGWL